MDVLNLTGVTQLLDAALSGYNVTIFAYGQTGVSQLSPLSPGPVAAGKAAQRNPPTCSPPAAPTPALTGSGKTYTMSGLEEVISSDNYQGDSADGIVTRSVNYLYNKMKSKAVSSSSLPQEGE